MLVNNKSQKKLGGIIVRLSKIKKMFITLMAASFILAIGAVALVNTTPNTVFAADNLVIEDLVQFAGSDAVYVEAQPSGGGFKIGQVSANGTGVTFSIPRPRLATVKIGLWSTNEANIWSNGYILQVNAKDQAGTVGIILKDGSENVLMDEMTVENLGETLTFVAYTVANEDGSVTVKVLLNGNSVIDKVTTCITLGNYINVYNDSLDSFSFKSTVVTFEDLPTMAGQDTFVLDAVQSGGGTLIGTLSKEGAGMTFKVDRPTANIIKLGLWNTAQAGVWDNGIILRVDGYEEKGKVRLGIGDDPVNPVTLTNMGEELTFECFPLVTAEGTVAVIRVNGQIVIQHPTTATLGKYFNAYNDLKVDYEFRSAFAKPEIEDVSKITGERSVVVPANDGEIGQLSDVNNGFSFKIARPTSGTLKVGLWNTSADNIWNNGYILSIQGKSEAGKIGVALLRGDETPLAKSRDVSGLGDELVFEVYKAFANGGIVSKVVVNGKEVISVHAPSVNEGVYINTWNELGYDCEIQAIIQNETIEYEDIFDITGKASVTINETSASVGQLSSVANGFTFKMARPTSGTLKVGLWNDGTHVWANGYILQIEGSSTAGNVGITLKRGCDEHVFCEKIEVGNLGDELTFECYKIYAGSKVTVKILLNGEEIVSAETQGVVEGTYITIYNELGYACELKSEMNIAEPEIFDYSALDIDNIAEREMAKRNGTFIGGGVGKNQGAKVKVTLTEANFAPIANDTNAIKFGLFKSKSNDVWGNSDKDGYILKFNLQNLTLSLISAYETKTYVEEVSVANKFTSGYEAIFEYSVAMISVAGVEVGQILTVKLNGEEVIKYISEIGSVELGSYFNVYNNTDANFKVGSTNNGINIKANVTGEGEVLGIVNVLVGTTARVKFVPKDGYKLASVAYNGTDVTETVVEGYYTIENVAETDELSVVFEKIEYVYANSDIKDFYDYTGVPMQTVANSNYSSTLRLGKTANYGIRFSVTFPVPAEGAESVGSILVGLFKINDGWVWGEGGFILKVDPLKQTVGIGGDTQDVIITSGNFQHDWTTGGKIDFEASVRDYFADGEKVGLCFILKVNGVEVINYRYNDRAVGDHFCLYNEISNGDITIGTSYELEELNYEVVGEEFGTVETDGILNGSATLKITPNLEVEVASVTLNGEDITSQLESDGTGYVLNLEYVSASDKLVVTFVNMQIIYAQAEVKDLYDITGGIASVKINRFASPLINLDKNSNFGVAFAIEPNATKGELKFGLFKGKENDVWDNDGYILSVDIQNAKVWLIVMTKDGTGTKETTVAEFIIPAEFAALSSIPVEVSVVDGTQNGAVVCHKITVKVLGNEILSYTAQNTALALGTYMNVYNNTEDVAYITTAYEMVELSVQVNGNGSVVDARAVEGKTAMVKLASANGSYPASATVNGTALEIVKVGADFYLVVPNASKDDVINVMFEQTTADSPTIYDLYDLIGANEYVFNTPAVNEAFEWVKGTGSEATVFNVTLPEDFDTLLKFGFFKETTAGHIWNGVGIIVRVMKEGSITLLDVEERQLDTAVVEAAKQGKTFKLEIGVVKCMGGETHVANCYYVKVNDVQVLEYYDYTCTAYGTKLMHPYLDKSTNIVLASTYSFYNVTSNEDEGIVGKVEKLVKAGDTVKINVGVQEGYVITSMKANGEDVTAQLVKEGMAYVLDLGVIESDVVLEIATGRKEATIRVEQVENAEIELSATTVNVGSNVTLTVKTVVGYIVEQITVNGQAVTEGVQTEGNVTTYEMKNVTVDTVFAVTLAQKSYNVTVNEFEGGSATFDTNVVPANGSVTVTVTLNEGYQLVKVTVNGEVVSLGIDGTFVISSVSEDKQIVVEVEAKDGGNTDSNVTSSDGSVSGTERGCFASVSTANMAVVGIIFVAAALIKRKRKD